MKNDEQRDIEIRSIFDHLLKLIRLVDETENEIGVYIVSLKAMETIKTLWERIHLFNVHDCIKRNFYSEETLKSKNMTDIDKARNYIAFLLDCNAPLEEFDKPHFIHALAALNHGEVQSIFEPTKRGTWGQAYSVARLQCLAIEHVNFLYGRGLQKRAARMTVANAYGIGAQENTETIRSWEVKAIREFLGEERANHLIKTAFRLGKLSIGMNIDDGPDKSLPTNWKPRTVDWSGVGVKIDEEELNEPEETSEILDDQPYGNAWGVAMWDLWSKHRTHCASLSLDPKSSKSEYEQAMHIAGLASHLMDYPLEICGRMYTLARSGQNIEFPRPWIL